MKQIVILLLALVLTGCAGLGSCALRSQLPGQWRALQDLDTRAAATPRISLSPVIGEMQAARRALSDLSRSGCDQDTLEAHTRLLEWMDADIDAYLTFMASKTSNDPLVQAYIARASDKRALAEQGMLRIQAK